MPMLAEAMETVQEVYARLIAARQGDPNEETLARILASWWAGEGVLPDWLGLPRADFRLMISSHFPGFKGRAPASTGKPSDPRRLGEMYDLRKLLIENRSERSPSELWMAEIVVAGCLGSDHLWRDLGLWKRDDLSKLMLDNFKPLAKRNDKDMKWKKFLYKQLCETEGIYTCRAPSCEVCADYHGCFG